jgi:hypothetical protein
MNPTEIFQHFRQLNNGYLGLSAEDENFDIRICRVRDLGLRFEVAAVLRYERTNLLPIEDFYLFKEFLPLAKLNALNKYTPGAELLVVPKEGFYFQFELGVRKAGFSQETYVKHPTHLAKIGNYDLRYAPDLRVDAEEMYRRVAPTRATV